MNQIPIIQIYSKKFNNSNPLIFFDRDGVITGNLEFLLKKSDIVFYKSALKSLHILNSYNFPIAIVTNQPGIARGLLSKTQVKEINNEIVRKLKKLGITIHAILSCPHHPNASIQKYRVLCRCRKPGSFMLEVAARKLNLSINNSYLIGDRTTDIKAGSEVGATTFLVKTGYGGKDKKVKIKPTYTIKTTVEATRIILNETRST